MLISPEHNAPVGSTSEPVVPVHVNLMKLLLHLSVYEIVKYN